MSIRCEETGSGADRDPDVGSLSARLRIRRGMAAVRSPPAHDARAVTAGARRPTAGLRKYQHCRRRGPHARRDAKPRHSRSQERVHTRRGDRRRRRGCRDRVLLPPGSRAACAAAREGIAATPRPKTRIVRGRDVAATPRPSDGSSAGCRGDAAAVGWIVRGMLRRPSERTHRPGLAPPRPHARLRGVVVHHGAARAPLAGERLRRALRLRLRVRRRDARGRADARARASARGGGGLYAV